jgi:hypothetical protein
MENGIWRFASATSRHPAEPGKYSALSAFGGFVTLASARIDRRPGRPSVNAVRMASALIADKAFDADKRVIEPLRAAGKTAVIPPKSTARNRATLASERELLRRAQAAMTRPPQLPRRRLPRCPRRLAQLTGPNAPSAPRPAVTASAMRRHQRRRVPAAAARRSGRPPRRRFRTAPSAAARVARTAHPGRRPPPPERRLAPRG